jgi:hypothetical protein
LNDGDILFKPKEFAEIDWLGIDAIFGAISHAPVSAPDDA